MSDEYNTLQIALRSIWFDRATTMSMWGYVVTIGQRNLDQDGLVYISPMSFKVRRDGHIATKCDRVHKWDGIGEIVYSTPWVGLESVRLDAYFIRDKRRLRDTGALLSDIFGDSGQGKVIADSIAIAVTAANPVAGVVLKLVPPVIKLVGDILSNQKDGIRIHATGSLRSGDIERLDETSEGVIPWGEAPGDKGFFETDWDLVTTSNPDAHVIVPAFPEEILKQLP